MKAIHSNSLSSKATFRLVPSNRPPYIFMFLRTGGLVTGVWEINFQSSFFIMIWLPSTPEDAIYVVRGGEKISFGLNCDIISYIRPGGKVRVRKRSKMKYFATSITR